MTTHWQYLTEEGERTYGLDTLLPRTPAPVPLAVPQEPQGRALLCVADDEGVGCARAASVSGFFSSVAMALRPTRQGDAGREGHGSKEKAHSGKGCLLIEIYRGGPRPIRSHILKINFQEKG